MGAASLLLGLSSGGLGAWAWTGSMAAGSSGRPQPEVLSPPETGEPGRFPVPRRTIHGADRRDTTTSVGCRPAVSGRRSATDIGYAPVGRRAAARRRARPAPPSCSRGSRQPTARSMQELLLDLRIARPFGRSAEDRRRRGLHHPDAGPGSRHPHRARGPRRARRRADGDRQDRSLHAAHPRSTPRPCQRFVLPGTPPGACA